MEQAWFKKMFFLLQIAVVAVFLGRAWQHIYWDAPYRTLLWDEVWMKPLVQGLLAMPWEDYVTNLSIDQGIRHFIRAIGVGYVLCALAALFIRQWKYIAVAILWVGAINLLVLAALYGKEKFYHIGQFLEYTLQWSSPIFLILLFKKQVINPRFLFWMKLSVALTFICHGLYAVGYYPSPGEFLQMTMSILNTTETGAIHFLRVAGGLDFVAGILLFLPGNIGKVALWYCFFWGLCTTLARVVTPVMLGIEMENVLLQSLHESLYRFPHFLMPIFVVLALHRGEVNAALNRQNI